MFHQGVVTARDASLLESGELAQADDTFYLPNDPALYKAPGRTAYGTVSATTVASVTLTGTSMTKSNAFGTAITGAVTVGSKTLVAAGAFTSADVGKRLYGTDLESVGYVAAFVDANTVTMSRNAKTTNATSTILMSTFEPGDFVTGTLTAANTKISSITNASTVVLDTAASSNGSDTVVIAPSVKGLAFLSFPGVGKDVLIAYAGSKLYKSAYAGATGTFTAIVTGLSNTGTETMEVMKAGNQYILLSTKNAPRIIAYKDSSGTDTLTTRLMGLQPVQTFTAEVQTANSWPVLLGSNYYWFVVTEVVNPGESDEAEGTYSGTPQVAQITSPTTQSVVIRHPVTYNDGSEGLTPVATHWRVYMSPGFSTNTTTPSLTLFRRIGTFSIGQTSATISDSNPVTTNTSGSSTTGVTGWAPALSGWVSALTQVSGTTAAFALAATSITFTRVAGGSSVTVGMPIYGTGIAAGTEVQAVTGAGPWTITLSKPTSAAGGGGGGGTFYVGPGSARGGTSTTDAGGAAAVGDVINFGFRNDAGNAYNGKTVIGVAVRIVYYWNNLIGSDDSGNDRGFNVSLFTGGSLVATKLNVGHKSGQSSTPTFGGNRWGAIECGGNGDTWGRTWSSGLADFLDSATFKVRVEKAGSADTIFHAIDSVEVRVYFTGVDVNLDGEPFATIVYTTQIGEQVPQGAAGPPPMADTGDTFEGQAIFNDTTNASLLWASIPDDYEKVPTLYQINLSGAIYTPIQVFRKIASVGIAFCRNALKRLNYFPTEADANATRGRAWEDITTDLGAVSKRAVATFDFPGRGPTGAFISASGLMLTDGITVWPGNVDLDWENTVSTANLTKCFLVNYPQKHVLAFYYVPTGATYQTKCIYFFYHPSHLKNGNQLSALGPCNVRAGAACRTNLANVTKLLTGNLSDGKVYVEDTGNTSEDLLVTITPTIRTRLIYPSDVGNESRIERLWLRLGGNGNDTTGVFTVNVYRQNIGETLTLASTTPGTTSTVLITGDRLVVLHADNLAESFQVEITKASLDAGFNLAYLYALGEGYGLESNRA
jgi:hypothetical protein